jgi:hypothetical protein
MVYAGLSVNTDQAGRMAGALVNAAKTGATSAADGVANGTSSTSQYRAIRQLTAEESAECDARLPWTKTPAGVLNCSTASDGNRWVWGK